MTRLEKILVVCQLLAGQLPWVLSLFGYQAISIYQPGIYRDHLWLIIVPVFIGFFATWAVIAYERKAMWGLGIIFFLVAAVVYYIRYNVAAISALHSLNWAMAYSLIALLAAFIYGLATGP